MEVSTGAARGAAKACLAASGPHTLSKVRPQCFPKATIVAPTRPLDINTPCNASQCRCRAMASAVS